MRELLDRHYRRVIAEPLPALGNLPPRETARTVEGREKVIDWLKHLENGEPRKGRFASRRCGFCLSISPGARNSWSVESHRCHATYEVPDLGFARGHRAFQPLPNLLGFEPRNDATTGIGSH